VRHVAVRRLIAGIAVVPLLTGLTLVWDREQASKGGEIPRLGRSGHLVRGRGSPPRAPSCSFPLLVSAGLQGPLTVKSPDSPATRS
jgi:hypothetical protein